MVLKFFIMLLGEEVNIDEAVVYAVVDPAYPPPALPFYRLPPPFLSTTSLSTSTSTSTSSCRKASNRNFIASVEPAAGKAVPRAK